MIHIVACSDNETKFPKGHCLTGVSIWPETYAVSVSHYTHMSAFGVVAGAYQGR